MRIELHAPPHSPKCKPLQLVNFGMTHTPLAGVSVCGCFHSIFTIPDMSHVYATRIFQSVCGAVGWKVGGTFKHAYYNKAFAYDMRRLWVHAIEVQLFPDFQGLIHNNKQIFRLHYNFHSKQAIGRSLQKAYESALETAESVQESEVHQWVYNAARVFRSLWIIVGFVHSFRPWILTIVII